MSAEEHILEALVHDGGYMRVDELLLVAELTAEETYNLLRDMWRRGLVTQQSEGLGGKEKAFKVLLSQP